MSYNSKNRTEYVYTTLKNQKANVKVLENSSNEDEMFKCADTIDLGRENIGVGGFYDYIINNIHSDINFYGIFNNDILDISHNFMDAVIDNFKDDIGILHPILNDIQHPWQVCIGEIYGHKKYGFIENVIPFYNYKLLYQYEKKLTKPIKQHFYGWMDKILSNISNEMNLHNIVINSCIATHQRSGVRNSIPGNYEDYANNGSKTYTEFLENNKELIKYN